MARSCCAARKPGSFVEGALLRWTPGGYRERRPLPAGRHPLVTPPTLVEVLRSGWSGAVPLLHPSADERQ